MSDVLMRMEHDAGVSADCLSAVVLKSDDGWAITLELLPGGGAPGVDVIASVGCGPVRGAQELAWRIADLSEAIDECDAPQAGKTLLRALAFGCFASIAPMVW